MKRLLAWNSVGLLLLASFLMPAGVVAQDPAVELAPAVPPAEAPAPAPAPAEAPVAAPVEAPAVAPAEAPVAAPVAEPVAIPAPADPAVVGDAAAVAGTEVPTSAATTPEAPPVESAIPQKLRLRDDITKHMVAVEALVVEVREERTRDLGIRYGGSTRSSGVLDGGNVSLGRSLSPVNVPTLIKRPEGVTGIGFQDQLPGLGISLVGMNVGSGVVSARLRALLDQGEATIRTRPIAVALHKTAVVITASDEVPYLDVQADGQTLIETYRDVGVTMNVTPTIIGLRPGVVELNIMNIEVSSVSSFVTTQNVDRPVFDTSKTNTKVTLGEGETFIVTGLKTRRTAHFEDRVPILSHIPLLGYLFRSQEDIVRISDVLFFITPYILEPGENFLLPFDFKNQRALGIKTSLSDR